MSDNKNKTRKPDFEIFAVRETGGEKDSWTKIGAAWKTENGNILPRLNFYPADPAVKLVMMPLKDKKEEN